MERYSYTKIFEYTVLTFFVLLLQCCGVKLTHTIPPEYVTKDVLLETELGYIVLRLSDKTPIHSGNFIKLVNQGFYDGISFHRVIENFLIQTGDPKTRAVPSKTPEAPYTLPPEIRTDLFHKRGSINAARMGDDQNPKQASSGTQFTIIQGKTYTDSTLSIAEKRINNWLAYNKVINTPKYKPYFKAYTAKRRQLDKSYATSEVDIAQSQILETSLEEIKTKLDSLTQVAAASMTPYVYPETHRTAYKTIGGAAHLDRNYVVFGTVVKGMDIVDRIATVKTDSLDKPIMDVRILSATMITRKPYE